MTLTRQRVSPPATEAELLDRVARLAGMTLAQLARENGSHIPARQTHAKGWIGAAVENYLGAGAGSKPWPDFPALGIELKTVPINRYGRPKEFTYVCTVPLVELHGMTWDHSIVRNKLRRVLWIPVEADPVIAFPERRLGSALLWSPDTAQERALRTDWEEIIEMIGLGELDHISSRHGKVLQIRPKGMNARHLTRADTETGETGLTLPRGFYLRAGFTHQILVRSEK